MTPADAARLLAIAAIYDRRTIGEIEAQAWADALDGLDPRDCAEAIRAHYRDTPTWLMPAHVRDRITAAHRTAAEQRKNDRQNLAIEAAREETTRTPHEWYLEAKRLVDEKRRELGYIADEPEGETA